MRLDNTWLPKAPRLAPAPHSWWGLRARAIFPRRPLHLLPTRTRPSLFGGD